jgi:hypothetical protein
MTQNRLPSVPAKTTKSAHPRLLHQTDAQIGQFGEGRKLACLVLARSPEIADAVRFRDL